MAQTRSDRELLALLAEARRTGDTASLDELSDEELTRLETLAESREVPATDATSPERPIGDDERHAPPDESRDVLDRVLSWLPAVAGTLYSLPGGGKRFPTGMALSGLGGFTGEGLRQTGEALRGHGQHLSPTMLAQVRAMTREGGIQMAGEGAGRLLASTGRALLRQTMGVRPSDVQAFGDIGDIAARERVAVGPGIDKPGVPTRLGGFERGSARATNKIREAAGDVRGLLTAATSRRVRIPADEAVKAVDRVMRKALRGSPGTYEREAAELSRLRKGLRNEIGPQGLTPLRAHELKTFYAEKAAQLYDKQAANLPVTARDRASLQFYEAAADGLRTALRQAIPKYQGLEARLQGLLGLQRVVTRAEFGTLARHGEFGVARVPAVAAMIQAASDPRVWSRIGLGLTSGSARQAPRLLTPMIGEALREEP